MGNYSRVLAAFHSESWAIIPEKLQSIADLLEMRSEGRRLTAEEIAARIGEPRRRFDNSKADRVAVLSLTGLLAPRANMFVESSGGTSLDAFGGLFDTAIRDRTIKAVVLDVDSPGGGVFGVEVLSRKIRNARSVKPITAVANSLAASAAFWIASAASEFFVMPGGQVGSVGVVGMHVDVSGAEKQAGIKTTLVHAGKHKVESSPYGSLKDGARAEVQRRVDQYHDTFIRELSLNRGVSEQTVRDKFGQGRVVSDRDALAAGMVDGVRAFDDVLAGVLAGKSGLSNRSGADAAAQLRERELWLMEATLN